MTSAACAAPHPVEPETFCNRRLGNHENHSAYSITAETYIDWPNSEYVEPPQMAKERAQRQSERLLHQISARTRGRAHEASDGR